MSIVVWTYSESERAANEAGEAGDEVAKKAGGQSVTLEVNAPRAGVHAVSKKLVLRGRAGSLDSPELISEAILRAAKKLNPSVIVVAATRQGREVAARLGAKLGAGCISEASKLSLSNNTLTCERSAYAGKIVARMAAPIPCVVSVKLGAYEPLKSSGGAVEELDVGEIVPKVKVLQRTTKGAGRVDLKSAKTIVSAGRGVKKKEDIAMLERLAELMGGALGCSRPLSSDLGWLSEEHHIGLTGVSVNPDLYLAIGISGQLQHIAGIKDSKVIAAINTDKDAPIFQAADYGIVGDLYRVVPALEKLLASKRR
jgi:electron transfer flavoprotein alpha subunit